MEAAALNAGLILSLSALEKKRKLQFAQQDHRRLKSDTCSSSNSLISVVSTHFRAEQAIEV